jgi:Zn-dependent metalloprotease
VEKSRKIAALFGNPNSSFNLKTIKINQFMKKIIYNLFAILLIAGSSLAGELKGIEAQRVAKGAERVRTSETSSVPEYVKFREGSEISFSLFERWMRGHFNLPASSGVKLINKSTDKSGYTHYRYQQTINGIPVEGTMYLLHVKNNMITSMNGMLFDKMNVASDASVSKPDALNKALQNMNASVYRWQVPAWEQQIKNVNNDPAATWYPKGELVYAPQNGKYKSENYRLCYKFDVYAQEPLDRQYVFVDALNGQVIYKINRIHDADATGTGNTAYSGPRTITTDSVNATTYRLRETGRGLGVETYNLQGGTNYVNTDFTDTDNNWNNVNAQLDQYATDAHWGAEMTYDYYMLEHNRNSIDDAGQKLLSYVHYDQNYVNAFWDGTEMTYGDGDAGQGYTPLTSLEITGHEISHGVTENTCGLIYQDESGAMNEGFSDCMGNAIRYYGKQPSTIDWFIGNEIGSTPFRNMANPNQFQNPDCYGGLYWNAPNEVHNNSGVLNFWFYLLSEGGTGTNDNNDVYNVSSIGIDAAADILYRTWSVYLFPTATYANARYYSIQAAIDLYGPCTPEVIAVTNAWYAVGVGAAFIPGVSSDFTASTTTFCQFPADVNFTNASNNAGSFIWYFGDGDTSSAVNPVHTYTTWGTFDVALVADGGTCGVDSIMKVGYVSVDSLNPCIVILPPNGTLTTQTSCAGQLYDSGGPNADYGDNTDATVTISPLGASTVTLTFTVFNMEINYDYLYIYDGPTTASPLIGAYTGGALPGGGTITSSGGSITLRQTSDVFLTEAGFALTWQCLISTLPPTVNFTANPTTSCTGTINFTDQSTNGPTSWTWDFGDGSPTSNLQNPSHTYAANGTYDVTLTAANLNGSNQLIKTSYITINQPSAPTAAGVSLCPGASANLTATGQDSLVWFTVPTGGTPVFTGASYNTPPIVANTTFYVETEIYPAPQSVGPVDNNFGTGSIFNNNGYHDIIFDCFAPVTLVSVKVYAQGAGNRTITLNDAGGNTLDQVTVNLPDGMSIVNLNFDLPVGTNLELGCEGFVDLYRNQGGATYPYTLAGVVSLTGSNAGAPGYYYYFYDWQLQGPPCVSPRTAVNVTLNAAPTAAFTTSNNLNTYTFTDASTGATSWFWDFGDGNTTTGQGPQVHTYTAAGTYIVMLIVSNGQCPDTAYFTVTIPVGIEEHQNISALTIYPNPASSLVNVEWYQNKQENISIQIVDQLGQEVYSENAASIKTGIHSVNISVNQFADGVYFLKMQGDNSGIVKKITIMK